MYSASKSQNLSQAIYDQLKYRLTAGMSTLNTLRQDQYTDTNGNVWPLIVLSVGGVETTGNEVAVILIRSFNAVSKDVFGNQLTAFNPTSIELFYQTGEPLTSQDLTTVMRELARRADALKQWVTQAGDSVQSQIDNVATILEVSIEDLQPSN